jgi:ABC-type Zn uptake system ZnuABC Zn-binding protein ZnuA
MLKERIMRRKILVGLLIATVGALVIILLLTQHAPPPVDIMSGSSLIANIIQDVAGDKMETRTLIPPGNCPGHYDVKPRDIRALSNSKAFFIHSFQANFPYITDLIEAADNPGLIIRAINVTGNWMVPAVQAEAVVKIAQALGEIDPQNAAYYEEKAAERAQAILDKGVEVRNRLLQAGVGEVKVICADKQRGFVKWAGFNVTATYGRPEDLSPADMERLVTGARAAGVALVIDNLQSGATATSEAMAQDIGAIQVTISNFPGGLENTETWEKAIDRNVELLLAALNAWRQQYG